MLLALDVDGTLLSPEAVLDGLLRETLCNLLRLKVAIALFTDNDYERSIKMRVVEPIPEMVISPESG